MSNPWPWLLAAQVIVTNRELNWRELWAIIRWYAHNRGYDGNALWAGEDSGDPDDVKKVQAARGLMERCGVTWSCGMLRLLISAFLRKRFTFVLLAWNVRKLRHYFLTMV